MNCFIGEDDLDRFEGWLCCQGIAAAPLQPDQLAMWRELFDEAKKKRETSPKVGLINAKTKQGDFLYAVAVSDDSNLWLALWVRRSAKGDVYVLIPRADHEWDPHTSYHKDGRSHMKSHGFGFLKPRRQPPTTLFRGAEQLVSQKGFGPKTVGASFDPTQFASVVEIEAGILGPYHGTISVDLIEPGCNPIPHFDNAKPVSQNIFKDLTPWLVIRVFAEQF
jgi:hypothetical protein